MRNAGINTGPMISPVKEMTGDFYVVNKSPILDLPIASGSIDV